MGLLFDQGLNTTDSPTFADVTITATDTASSGTALSNQITNTYNQTGTAGSTDFLINRTETALGSGSHYFADFQVGGTSKFNVANSGVVNIDIGSSNSVPLNVTKAGTGAVAIFTDNTGDGYVQFESAGVAQFIGANTSGIAQASVNMGSAGGKAGEIALSAGGSDKNILFVDSATGYVGIQPPTAWNSTWHTPAHALSINESTGVAVYNSYTDASNNEYLEAGFDTNVAYLRMVSNGTGSDRDLVLSRRSGVETVTLTNSQFQVNVNGAIYRLTLGNGFYPVSPTSLGDSGNGRQWSIGYVNEIVMDKTTSDDGFINFQATADADATSAISTLTTSGATTHHIQIEINGTKAWIAASTNAPT